LTTRKEEFKFPCIEVIVYIRISDASFFRGKRLLGLLEAELAGLGCCHRMGEQAKGDAAERGFLSRRPARMAEERWNA
jgi:hypothetical protein